MPFDEHHDGDGFLINPTAHQSEAKKIANSPMAPEAIARLRAQLAKEMPRLFTNKPDTPTQTDSF